MNTNRALDLLETFKNGISHTGNKLQDVLDYQDVIGRSTMEEIVNFANSLDQSKRNLFYFANMNCLSSDLAIDIMKKIVLDKVQEKIDEENAILHDTIYNQSQEIQKLKKERDDLYIDAEKFWQIRNLLS